MILWIIVNVIFWSWWWEGQHIGNGVLFSLFSAALFYEITLLPSFYLFFLGQMKKPVHIPVHVAEEAGVIGKVGVITLHVPGSESLEIVERQLKAMVNIQYPHDSWILVDKKHSPEVQTLAERLGVKYFCRHDASTWGKKMVQKWNQSNPPFKAKTKAGNVNSWLDAFGYREYSHFVQLDVDHIPNSEYLDKTLGYFVDKNVAWVQAPSVYGNMEHWTARGAAEQEFVLQGPLQAGFFGFCRTPFIIGSHCTYDMRAIQQIGGFQPTRAEDHLDTVHLAANGKQGVFVPEVIALGDGPETFETYAAQQFAWAYSMMQVFFGHTPKAIRHYTWRQGIQFLFVQTWYILWSLSMLVLFSFPIVSLFSNQSIANVNYWQFLWRNLLVVGTGFVIWFWSRPWHLPKGIGLSWRGVVLHVARWPVVLSALIQVLMKVEKPYMITVKGLHIGENRPFVLQTYVPYLGLVFLSLIAGWKFLLTTGTGPVQGYLLFAIQGASMFVVVFTIALALDMSAMIGEGVTVWRTVRLRIQAVAVVMMLIIGIVTTSYFSYQPILEAITYKEQDNGPQIAASSDDHTRDFDIVSLRHD
jgi:cellulose synthase (UDP-forming)